MEPEDKLPYSYQPDLMKHKQKNLRVQKWNPFTGQVHLNNSHKLWLLALWSDMQHFWLLLKFKLSSITNFGHSLPKFQSTPFTIWINWLPRAAVHLEKHIFNSDKLIQCTE
jgi:hypothetical protein